MTEPTANGPVPWFERESELGGAIREAHGRERPPTPRVPGCEDLVEIGRGGQGTVYSALQSATRRRVAVKVLADAPGHTRAAHLRFEREVEIVASFRDPRLVQVHSAGTTEDGRPFVVMELVRGVHLDEAPTVAGARAAGFARPGADPAIALFAAICEGMDQAHRHGIIHRDLKPSNILIDEHGAPRILDFGLAKASGVPGAAGLHEATAGKQFLGSLPWTSPEQAEGRTDAVDVRSDVYALGATLYHVVTGKPPCPTDQDLRRTLDAIVNEPPPAPTLVEPRCNRDLEAVILRALAKDPADRYATAGLFARDLRRLLANEPIEARRENAWTALVKLARRRRRLAIAASLIAVAAVVIGAMVYAFWRRAEAESRRAEASLDFFLDSIGMVDPARDGAGTKLADALDHVSGQLDRRFGDGETSARLRFRIRLRDLYFKLGRYDRALAEAEAVAALTRDQAAPPPSPEFRSRWNGEGVRALALYRLGRAQEALELYRGVHAQLASAFGSADADALQAAGTTGMILRALGRLDEAERMLRDVVSATAGPSAAAAPLARAMALDNLAAIAEIRGVPAEAEAPQREATELFASVKGDHATETLAARSNLGNLLLTLDRPKDAVAILAPVAATFRDRSGPRNPMTLAASHNLGVARLRAGDAAEGARVLREVYDIRLADRGPSAPDTLLTLNELAIASAALGDAAETERLRRLLTEGRAAAAAKQRERQRAASSPAASRGTE